MHVWELLVRQEQYSDGGYNERQWILRESVLHGHDGAHHWAGHRAAFDRGR